MKLNLRNKTIFLIALTTVGALLMAGIIINFRVNHAFDVFVDDQINFLQSRGLLMQSVQRLNGLRKQLSQMTLEAQFQRQLWQGIASAGIISLAVAIGIGVYFANRLTSPLKKLKTQIDRMKSHNYDEPLSIQGDSEITDVAKSFEALRNELIRVEELRKDLLSDMAHEITTPLQS
jgi:nitrogen fixation/metabolism regulation signal transduction histidine kinase